MIDDWTLAAACKGREDLMFPHCETRGPDLYLAKRVCLGCPDWVREECLADAYHHHDRYGIRGGLSTPERLLYKAGAPIRTCTRCGVLYANLTGTGRCLPCLPVPKPTPALAPSEAVAV